jgi:hypothetical protein
VSDPHEPVKLVPREPAEGLADWVDRWILTYARDPSLGPVAIALLGHVVVVVAGVALVALRTGSVLAWIGLVLMAALTLALCGLEVKRFGRPGGAALMLLLTWIASGALVWFAERTGVL